MPAFGALTQFALVDVGSQQPQGVFSSLSQPIKKGLAVAVIASFGGFVAPPVARIPVFSEFSKPISIKRNLIHPEWIRTPAFLPTVFQVFTKFSEPQINRAVLVDEQLSKLFEFTSPPPPFVGFVEFSKPLKANSIVLTSSWNHVSVIVPPDTHDIVFVDDRKKKKRPDLIEEELRRRAKLRADLELAFYGPIPEPLPPPRIEVDYAKQPIDVMQLASIMANLQHQQMLKSIAADNEDEESDLDLILSEIG